MSLLKSLTAAILKFQARAIIRKYKPSIVAITGSVGKTSTKDAVYAALSEHAFVRKSEKSFNSELGLPLTILGRQSGWRNPLKWLEIVFDGFALMFFRARYPDWLVLEVGADRPGDIRSVAKWLPVDIAVITRLPEVPVHVEYFESPEEVIEEKAALITALKPSGTLVLYADDERVRSLAGRAMHARVLMFGFSPEADVRGGTVEFLYENKGRLAGMRADITCGNTTAEVSVRGVIGSHAFMPLLSAMAVGQSLGLAPADIAASFERNYVPPPGRMRLIDGIKDSLVIDDTYNSSPAAVAAGLNALAQVPASGRKIAVLGDMLELGRYSVEEHRKIGAQAAQISSLLVCVGLRARDIAQAALDAGMPDSAVLQYEGAEKAGEELAALVQAGDCIYVKGSQSMRMERAVKQLMAEPQKAWELLVRQEKEWGRR